MKRLILCAAALCLLGGPSQADEGDGLPKDIPPVVGRAVIGPRAKNSEWTIRLTLPKVQWEVVGEVVPKKQWPELRAVVEKETRTLQMDGPSQLAPSRVTNVNGMELKREEIVKRLAKETPVLVSLSGAMIDRYYLELTRPDALIIILGPRDGMPAPELLPVQKPAPGK